jgi:hypothetical protein
MTVLPGLATNLRDAYRVCDIKPLAGEALDRYYVPLESRVNATYGIQIMLGDQEPGEFAKVLFTGHVGCGKSSELAKIARNEEAAYRIIYVQAEEQADPYDLEYTDLYLLIIKEVEFALRQDGLKFDGLLLTSFEDWFKDITKETEATVEKSVNVNAEASLGSEAPFLAKFLVKMLAQIKAGSKDKTTIRQTLIKDFSRLQTDVNLLLTDADKKFRAKFPQKKGFLLILDGLDKCPPEVSEKLFVANASQLQDLNINVIYTVPIATLYAPNFSGSTFGRPVTVPMVNIYAFHPEVEELEHRSEYLDQVASVIEARVDVDRVFESRELLLELAKASGGHIRHLMQMMRDACNNARVKAHTKIQAENVVYATKQLQFGFERSLLRIYYDELVQIGLQKEISKAGDDIGRQLLFSTAVLEYNGDNRWVYPHPMVRRSDIYKRSRRELPD